MPNTAVLKLQIIADATKAVSAMKDMSGAADKASGKTQTAGSRLKSMGMTAARVAGAAALGGLVAMMKTGVSEQSDYLKGQAQLAAGLKSTGNAANTSVKQMEDLASSIQNYSGQTDDSIVAAEQLMLTFTNVGNAAGKNNDVFDQAIKMTADMAARMGGDASTYAIQLGKALNDPIKGLTSLTRIGVSFTEAQKKQIKQMQESGDTMGAQKVILAELRKEFGGSAKAAGETLPGQMAKAKRSFEDISQQLVVSLMPAFTKLADMLTGSILPAFAKVMKFIGDNIQWLLPLVTGIYLAVKAYKAWVFVTTALTAANRALMISFATNPITLWIVAIVAIVAALVYAYKHFTWFRNAVNAVLHAIGAAFVWLGRAIQTVWNKALGILKRWGPVALAVLAPFLGIPLLIYRNWDKLVAWTKNVWDKVIGVFRKVTGWVSGALRGVTNAITAPFSSAWNWIQSHVLNPMSRMFSGIVGGISRALSGVTNAITAPFSAAWDWIQSHVLGPIKTGWNGIANAINAIHFSVSVPKFVPGIGGKGFTFDPPNVPLLRRGAYVTGPMAAIVGEGSRPEFVVPDDKLRQLIRQELNNAGVTVIVNGALDPDAVARQIDKLLRGRARRVGGPRVVGTATL